MTKPSTGPVTPRIGNVPFASPLTSPSTTLSLAGKQPERPAPVDKIIIAPAPDIIAEEVSERSDDQQAKVSELLATLVAALDHLDKENAEALNEHAPLADTHHEPAASSTAPATGPADSGLAPTRLHSQNQHVDHRVPPGKMTPMAEALRDCFSGRAGTVAGAVVFGLVVVSAVALMSAFPPILLFGALFGLAVAAEMVKPVSQFQTDLRENNKWDHAIDEEDGEEDGKEEKADETLALPLAPTTPLQPAATTVQPGALVNPSPGNPGTAHVPVHLPIPGPAASYSPA